MKSFDLRLTPFSCAGSHLQVGLSKFGEGRRLEYETARRSVWRQTGGGWGSHFFRIELVHGGEPVDYHAKASPAVLEMIHDDACGTIVFADRDTLLMRVSGGAMRLDGCHTMAYMVQLDDHAVTIHDHHGACTHHFRVESGGVLRCERNLSMGRGAKKGAPSCAYIVTLEPTGDGPAVMAVRTTLHEQRFTDGMPSFEAAVAEREAEYAEWQAKMPRVAARHRAAAEFAWHMLWNQRMGPIGRITRESVIMSRHWMRSVWAWDACFSALGIGPADPKLAWEQVLVHLDHQLPNGQLPDGIHDGEAAFGWVKPPVQGWTISHLLRELPSDASLPYLAEAYEKLTRWTEWWYACRDYDHDGVCSYVHGNDSGWDNSTVFDAGEPVEVPDLSAYLVLQWEALAEMARRLGRDAEAEAWDRRADEQLKRLLDHLVVDSRFIARDQRDNPLAAADTALLRVPIILGHRLPEAVRRGLLADLQPDGRFVTEHGLATEAIDSPHYEQDGYWRGPMWAPPVFMVFDGLLDLGEEALAAELAERFCRTCMHEPVAMFENYDMTTGAGLRCKAYSWTAAVFVRLAAWLAARQAPEGLTVETTLGRRAAARSKP